MVSDNYRGLLSLSSIVMMTVAGTTLGVRPIHVTSNTSVPSITSSSIALYCDGEEAVMKTNRLWGFMVARALVKGIYGAFWWQGR